MVISNNKMRVIPLSCADLNARLVLAVGVGGLVVDHELPLEDVGWDRIATLNHHPVRPGHAGVDLAEVEGLVGPLLLPMVGE